MALNTPQSQMMAVLGHLLWFLYLGKCLYCLFLDTSERFPGFRPVVTLSQHRQGNTPTAFSSQICANFQDMWNLNTTVYQISIHIDFLRNPMHVQECVVCHPKLFNCFKTSLRFSYQYKSHKDQAKISTFWLFPLLELCFGSGGRSTILFLSAPIVSPSPSQICPQPACVSSVLLAHLVSSSPQTHFSQLRKAFQQFSLVLQIFGSSLDVLVSPLSLVGTY